MSDSTIKGGDVAGGDRPSAAHAPTVIGSYRVVHRLGEGGMGTVFLVEQTTPVRRRAALKLIKGGADSQRVLARFAAEQQALALMSHDCIARVFDAGATPDGRPYFVMEYVDGVPLDVHCDASRLTLDQRIRLFQRVCEGVAHAHQKGVVHRDLKPGNVLVVEQDGRATPKIIDFGIARALDEPLQGRPFLTEQGQLLGTPEYMSPEQAGGTQDVDTRTDVWSLGVILYELLTGTLPFASDELRREGVRSIQRLICEREPPRPSTRVASTAAGGADQTAYAQARRLPTATWVKRLHGDLDWIVLRALEKDRGRRYGTPMDLAADLERHLRHEPVAAGPPSAWYRASKFVRRYRGQVAAGAALLVALAAGLLASLWQWHEARAARDDARAKGQQATVNLERFVQLLDVVTLDELKREVDTLWPESPELVPRYQRWIDAAARLEQSLERHRGTLDEMRRRGAADPQPDPRHDQVARLQRAVGARTAEMNELRQRLATQPSEATVTRGRRLRREIEQASARIPELEAAIERAVRWRFADRQDQLIHDTLVRHVIDLEQYVVGASPIRARMQARLEFARSVRRLSLEEPASAWQAAIASIADPAQCPRYQGLRIAPQLGLVPLRRNPASGLWEFHHLRTGAAPIAAPDGRWRVSAGTGLVLVLVPGGETLLGAQARDPGQPRHDAAAEYDEQPLHVVPLAPFFLSAFEMTQDQWERWTGGNPSYYKPGGFPVSNTHPVESVTWEMCRCAMFELGLDLPTEAQWEHACRAGTATRWYTGDDAASLTGHANVAGEADGWPFSAPVDAFLPNPFGLVAMHGNAWEWCRDWRAFYSEPVVPDDGERIVATDIQRMRIHRGGSFLEPAAGCRSSRRASATQFNIDRSLGVRPSRRLE